MSVWTTRSLEREREYIVLQHPLKGVNHVVNGIKFRDGYAVVEKGSKTYFTLKRIPVLRSSKEFPISHLKNLHFITRTSDIKTVFGQDVYAKFLDYEKEVIKKLEEQKLQEKLAEQAKREEAIKLKENISQQIAEAKESGNVEVIQELTNALPTITKCSCHNEDGQLCSSDAVIYSPSGYCAFHIVDDPKLPEFGLNKPQVSTKQQKKDFRAKVKKVLQEAKDNGKF